MGNVEPKEEAVMPKLVVTNREGIEATIDGTVGRSVMEVIRDAGFGELLAMCGGSCSCATCHVYVDPALALQLPEMGDEEDQLLDSSDVRTRLSRLSCQITFTKALDGLRVTIAPEE